MQMQLKLEQTLTSTLSFLFFISNIDCDWDVQIPFQKAFITYGRNLESWEYALQIFYTDIWNEELLEKYVWKSPCSYII